MTYLLVYLTSIVWLEDFSCGKSGKEPVERRREPNSALLTGLSIGYDCTFIGSKLLA